MAHYEIKITSPAGDGPIVVQMEKPDDLAALNAALEICSKQTVEVWDGARQIGAVSMTGTPRLML